MIKPDGVQRGLVRTPPAHAPLPPLRSRCCQALGTPASDSSTSSHGPLLSSVQYVPLRLFDPQGRHAYDAAKDTSCTSQCRLAR